MNRPDEIAALADELDACARNPGRDSTECAVEGELLRRVAAALRASATSPGDATTSARDVREALMDALDSPTIAAIASVFSPRNNALTKSYSQQVADIIAPRLNLSNLDAAAPAAGGDGWCDDPTSDERWNEGCDFAMKQLCAALDVDPNSVTWDAATETVDGDIQAVIWNILRAKYGEDGPVSAPLQAPAHSDAVRVKPLEWKQCASDGSSQQAVTPVGKYVVWEINGTGIWRSPDDAAGRLIDGGLQAAKAESHSDYERRILSALTAPAANATPAPAEKAGDDLGCTHKTQPGEICEICASRKRAWECATDEHPDRAHSNAWLASELEKLCCAETEGKFFNLVTDNIQEIFAALRATPTPPSGDVVKISWLLTLAAEGLEFYRQERLRCGHKFGTKKIGLYDNEVDDFQSAKAVIQGFIQSAAHGGGTEGGEA
jgi:hypothetical protein